MNTGVSPLSNHSEGKPIDEIGGELKTNYKDLVKRYELSARMIWAKTPPWKQSVINDCRINGTDDRIFDEYAKAVRLLAEDETAKLEDCFPAIPEVPKAAKIPDPQII